MKIINTYPFTFEGEIFDIYFTDNRKFLIPLRPICERLGIDWGSQLRRTKRDPTFDEHLFTIKAPLMDVTGFAREREVTCITAQRLHYWFGGITIIKVKPELRKKIQLFKSEMADAVFAYFRSTSFSEDTLAELDAVLPPEERRFFQLMDEARKSKEKIAEHEGRIGKVEGRLKELESRMLGTDFINQAQSRQYLNAVNTLGDLLKQRKPQKAAPYAVIHNAVKTEFKCASYQLIPEGQFPYVMSFLADWWIREAPDLKLPEVFKVRQDRLI